MKKIVVILFLFTFLFQCSIKTIIVTAFYSQQEYITKTFCENKNKPQMNCNGKCHLQKQLNKEEKNEQKFPDILKEQLELSITQTNSVTFIDSCISIKHYHLYLITPYHTLLTSVFHPPSSTFVFS